MIEGNPFPSKIFLVGLPGSGKSTLGKELANKIGRQFIDLDHEIERSEGSPIPEIFIKRGESGFRQIERRTLLETIDRLQEFVMATGGGAPCFEDNLSVMKKSGVVIFLDVPPKVISDRIQQQAVDRPLLKNETPDSLKDRIEFLRSQRIAFYRQANYVFSNKNIEVGDIIEKLSLNRN